VHQNQAVPLRSKHSGEWRSGSAPALGAGGRGFKSPLPDSRSDHDARVGTKKSMYIGIGTIVLILVILLIIFLLRGRSTV
jgi:hypothetical protein